MAYTPGFDYTTATQQAPDDPHMPTAPMMMQPGRSAWVRVRNDETAGDEGPRNVISWAVGKF